MNKKLIISTINYHGAKKTQKMIESIASDTLPYNITFIILDNSCPPEIQSLESLLSGIKDRNPSIDFIIHTVGSNIGFGRGHNLNFNVSGCNDNDFFLVINNDVVAGEDNFLQKMMLAANESCIISPIILRSSDKSVWNAGGLISKITGDLSISSCVNNHANSDPDFLSGCCLLMSGSTYRKLEGFCECFFMYAEDLDFSIRATQSGFKLKVIPVSLLHDIGSGVSGHYSDLYLYENTKNRLICLRKFNLGLPFIRHLFFFIKYVAARSLQLIAFSSKPHKQIAAALKGYRDGFF